MNCHIVENRFSKNYFIKYQLPENTESLYRAQEVAKEVLQSQIFPCYRESFLNAQSGPKWAILQVYSKIYNTAVAISELARGILFVPKLLAKGIYCIGDFTLGWALRPTFNFLFPVNLMNGKRHYFPVPKWIEKFWGEVLLFPTYTLALSKTNECLSGTRESIANRVDRVFHRIVQQNSSLLNPKMDWTHFNYHVMTAASSTNNAFSLPAGGIVVFSQIVKEMQESILANAIKEAKVTFEDGSKAIVDLRDVAVNDVLAALLGHEITHAAARHTVFHIVINILSKIILSPFSLNSRVYQFIQNFISRKSEYEADIAGVYLGTNAGFNPLGAVYLQEMLKNLRSDSSLFLHSLSEWMSTHPFVEHRKRAILAAITEIDPACLKNKVQWQIQDLGYDYNRSDLNVCFAKKEQLKIQG